MERNHYSDIQEIKTMMERSTKFISLSGLSGILVGLYALVASLLAYNEMQVNYSDAKMSMKVTEDVQVRLIGIAVITLVVSLITALLLTYRKANKKGENIFGKSSKQLMVNVAVPLAFGGMFCLLLLKYGLFGLLAPSTLLFYGLAIFCGSKYTLPEIKTLAICCMVLGLLNAYFIGYGLWFWALGFGVCHIIYGSVMYFKYDKK